MAEYPALPVWTDALLGDTLHLTTAQFGAYLLMLIVAWREKSCSLQNDDAYLSKITRMDKRTWAANKDVLMAFWKVGADGRLRQGRLSDERKFVEDISNKNSKNSKSRWLKNKEIDNADALPEIYQINAPTPTPTPIIPLRDPLAEMVGFSDFWHLFPHKTGMGFAREAYKKALTITTHTTIMAALKKQLPALEAKKYPTPDPAKWLAGECWSDGEPLKAKKNNYAGMI